MARDLGEVSSHHAAVDRGAREALRQATRPCHARLEARLAPDALTASKDAYRRVLAALYGFYEPLEPRVYPRVFGGGTRRAKAPLLRADLLALGLSPSELAGLPRCAHLPECHGLPAALGIAYVLEGASLGGRLLARRAHERLGLTAASGARFFHGYGRDTARMWRGFLTMLEGALDERGPDRALASSRHTFESLEIWLSRRGVLS
jgi:heme oxygenase (biliverdin-IX-beta and delta-forming)